MLKASKEAIAAASAFTTKAVEGLATALLNASSNVLGTDSGDRTFATMTLFTSPEMLTFAARAFEIALQEAVRGERNEGN